MAFDSIFNGDPTTPNVIASGKATLGIDISSGQLYFKDDAVAGWQKVASGSSSVSGLISVKLTISSSDMTNWNDVPVELLPALPADQFYDVLSASFVINVVTPLDSGPDNGLQIVTMGQSLDGGTGLTMGQGFLSATVDSYVAVSIPSNILQNSLMTSMLGSPLVVFGNDMTGGAGTTLDIYLNYAIRTVS